MRWYFHFLVIMRKSNNSRSILPPNTFRYIPLDTLSSKLKKTVVMFGFIKEPHFLSYFTCQFYIISVIQKWRINNVPNLSFDYFCLRLPAAGLLNVTLCLLLRPVTLPLTLQQKKKMKSLLWIFVSIAALAKGKEPQRTVSWMDHLMSSLQARKDSIATSFGNRLNLMLK